jgi:hypothetical protein
MAEIETMILTGNGVDVVGSHCLGSPPRDPPTGGGAGGSQEETPPNAGILSSVLSTRASRTSLRENGMPFLMAYAMAKMVATSLSSFRETFSFRSFKGPIANSYVVTERFGCILPEVGRGVGFCSDFNARSSI